MENEKEALLNAGVSVLPTKSCCESARIYLYVCVQANFDVFRMTVFPLWRTKKKPYLMLVCLYYRLNLVVCLPVCLFVCVSAYKPICFARW